MRPQSMSRTLVLAASLATTACGAVDSIPTVAIDAGTGDAGPVCDDPACVLQWYSECVASTTKAACEQHGGTWPADAGTAHCVCLQ